MKCVNLNTRDDKRSPGIFALRFELRCIEYRKINKEKKAIDRDRARGREKRKGKGGERKGKRVFQQVSLYLNCDVIVSDNVKQQNERNFDEQLQ